MRNKIFYLSVLIISALILGSKGLAAPLSASFDQFFNNATTDNLPAITGIATDETQTIVGVDCRIDGGSWSVATPISGANTNTEKFTWTPSEGLARGLTSHEVTARIRDAATISDSLASYSFYLIGDRPEIKLQSRGTIIESGDTIASDPKFDITIMSNKIPITARSYLIEKSSSSPTILPITLVQNPTNSYLYTGTYFPTLTDGNYLIRIEAFDNSSQMSSKEVNNLLVQTNSNLLVQGTALNYPNPFNPETTSTAISYTLSKAANVSLSIHDIMGNQLSRKYYASGTEGGKAGYNEVSWDGKDDSGNMVGNGIYIYLVIGDGTLLTQGKTTVLKR